MCQVCHKTNRVQSKSWIDRFRPYQASSGSTWYSECISWWKIHYFTWYTLYRNINTFHKITRKIGIHDSSKMYYICKRGKKGRDQSVSQSESSNQQTGGAEARKAKLTDQMAFNKDIIHKQSNASRWYGGER